MTIRQFLQRFGKPVAILLIAYCAIRTVHGSLHDITRLHPNHFGPLALAMLLFVVHYLIQAAGWCLLVRSLGQPLTVRDSVRMYFLSLIARWMPGRIWYTATRLYLARQLGLSVTAVAFAIVLELIYILIGGVVTTVLFAGAVLRGILATGVGQTVLYGVVAVIVAAGVLAIRPATLTSLSRRPTFRKIIRRIAGEDLTDANQPTMKTSASLLLIAYYTLFWIYSGVMFGVLASAFIPMNSERWIACIPAFAGSWLIGFFSIITPAGLGVREFAMTLMLKSATGGAAALVLSIASRLAMMFTELVLAGIAFLFLRDQASQMPWNSPTATGAGGSGIHLPPDTLPDANELLDDTEPSPTARSV